MTPEEMLQQLATAARSHPGPSEDARRRILDGVERSLLAPPSGAAEPEPEPEPLFGKQSLSLVKIGIGGVALGVTLVILARIGASREGDSALPTNTSSVTNIERAAELTPKTIRAEPLESTPVSGPGSPPESPDLERINEPAAVVGAPEIRKNAPKSRQRLAKISSPEDWPEPERLSAETIAAEIALIKQITAALNQRQTARVLELAAEHERRFANGQLIEERTAAKTRALCQTGRLTDGQDLLARFEVRWPTSIYLSAIRHDCGVDSATDPEGPGD